MGGFFRTAYKTGRPFVVYIIVAFFLIGVFEALHHVPGFERLNAFGTEDIAVQLILFITGIALYILLTVTSCRKAYRCFEKIDL